MKPTYDELVSRIEQLRQDLAHASTQEEANYFGMELLVAEEYLEHVMARGRR